MARIVLNLGPDEPKLCPDCENKRQKRVDLVEEKPADEPGLTLYACPECGPLFTISVTPHR
jgi:hypothetical protein